MRQKMKQIAVSLLVGCTSLGGLATAGEVPTVPTSPWLSDVVADAVAAEQERAKIRLVREDTTLEAALASGEWVSNVTIDIVGDSIAFIRRGGEMTIDGEGVNIYTMSETESVWLANAVPLEDLDTSIVESFTGDAAFTIDEQGVVWLSVKTAEGIYDFETGQHENPDAGSQATTGPAPAPEPQPVPGEVTCQAPCAQSDCSRTCRGGRGCLSYCDSHGDGICACVDNPGRRPRTNMDIPMSEPND